MWQCFSHGDIILKEEAKSKTTACMFYVSILFDCAGVWGIVALVKEKSHQQNICQFSAAPDADGVYSFNHVLLGQGLLHLLFGSNSLN